MNRKYPVTSPTENPIPKPKTPIIVLIMPISNLIAYQQKYTDHTRRKIEDKEDSPRMLKKKGPLRFHLKKISLRILIKKRDSIQEPNSPKNIIP